MSDTIQGDDEQVLLVVRKHWISFFHDALYVLLPAVVALGLLIVISSVPQTGIDAGLHVIAAILFPMSLLAVVIMVTILWSDYYLDMVVVTDRRLFFASQMSLTRREVLGWNLHEVQNVNAAKDNFLESVFNFGTIRVTTSGEDGGARIEGIPDPEYVCAVILRQDDKYGELKETTRKQQELLKFLSHEVKGHLTKSKAAFAAIVEGDYGPVTEPLVGMAHMALEDSERGVDTVMSILDNASLESGDMRFEMKEFDLAKTLHKMVEVFWQRAVVKKISLVSSIPETCVITGDEKKIEQHVIRNLIDNAIRYTSSGQIDVGLQKDGDICRVSVSDTGVGMTESDMKTLFTEGGHGEHSRDVNPESTGYGLYIAKQIVEKHGGRMYAASDGPEKGSTFVVEFPLT